MCRNCRVGGLGKRESSLALRYAGQNLVQLVAIQQAVKTVQWSMWNKGMSPHWKNHQRGTFVLSMVTSVNEQI